MQSISAPIHSRHIVRRAAMITGPRKRAPPFPNDCIPPKIPISTNRNGSRAAASDQRRLNEIFTDQQYRCAETKEPCGRQQSTAVKDQYQCAWRDECDPTRTERHHRQRHRQHYGTAADAATPVRKYADTDNSAFHNRSCPRSRSRWRGVCHLRSCSPGVRRDFRASGSAGSG